MPVKSARLALCVIGWGLRSRFPRLIHCRVSGLGGAPGYDFAAQAMSGLMSVNDEPANGPTRIGIPIVDMASGLNVRTGILLALKERQRSGQGQFIDINLFDTAVGLLHPRAAICFVNGQPPKLVGGGHPNVVP